MCEMQWITLGRKHLAFWTFTCVLVIRRRHAFISGRLHSEAGVRIKRRLLNHVGSGANVRKARCEKAWSHPRLQWWLSFPLKMVVSCYAFFIRPQHYFLPSVPSVVWLSQQLLPQWIQIALSKCSLQWRFLFYTTVHSNQSTLWNKMTVNF